MSEQNPPIQGFLNKDYKNCREGNLVIIYCYLICLRLVIFLSNCSVDLIYRLKIDKVRAEKRSSNFQKMKKGAQHHEKLVDKEH